jgi:rRNA-processing protein FCF1|uniref:VapC9 PIN-like domain-containing protein n=1 Tax=Ignisphaera aggregans TaxID=334771 RepID=A0A7J2U694_9CREN
MECIIILDTSALFIVAENLASLDSIYEIAGECKIVVIRHVVEELENIAKREHGRKAFLAKWILQNIIPRLRVVDIEFQGQVDDAIVEYAHELMEKGIKGMVATTDGKIKERVLRKGIRVITYRESEKIFEVL